MDTSLPVEVVTVTEFSHLTEMSAPDTRRAIRCGKIKAIKVRGRWYILRSEVGRPATVVSIVPSLAEGEGK